MNWNSFNKAAKAVSKDVKNLKHAAEFFKDFPGEGYMKDNISKKMVVIKDCKSSSLRRYVKLLDNFYYLATLDKDKEIILKKKVEIETELNSRDDAIC